MSKIHKTRKATNTPRADPNQLIVEANALKKQYDMSLEDLQSVKNKILSGTIKSFGELYKQIADMSQRLEVFSKQQLDSLTDLSVEYNKILKLDKKTLDNKESLIEKLEKELEKKEKSGKYDSDSIDHSKELLKNAKEQLELANALHKRNAQFGGHLQVILDHTSKITESFKQMLPPYMGKLADHVAAGMERALISGKGLQLATAGISAAFLGAFAVLMKVQHQSQEIAKNTGLSVEQAHELVKSSYKLQSSSGNYLSTQTEIIETQQALMKEFQNFHKLSESTTINIANLSNAFGYSAEHAAKVQGIFEMIGGMSADMSTDLQAAVGSLAEAAGVAPGEVIADIAENAGVASKYFAGQPRLLAKAAVELKKIGLSLKDAASLSDSLLNIESSLTNQYVAAAMLGRQINLDTARQLVLQNDIVGATKTVLDQVGSIAEFDAMTVLEKNAIAAATGLTTEQLAKSLWLAEATKTASAEELALIDKYGSQLENINGLNKEQIIERAKSVQVTEQLTTNLDKLATSIMPALVSLSEGLTPVFQIISAVVSTIATGMSTIVGFANQYKEILLVIGGLLAANYLWKQKEMIQFRAQLVLERASIAYKKTGSILDAASAAFRSLGITPFVGYALATAATLAAVGLISNLAKVDDAVIPPAGHSRVMSGPEGSIAFNDKDTIVAGTNLGGGSGGSGKLEMLLEENNKLLRQVVNRPIIIGRDAIDAIGNNIKVNSSYS